MSLPGSALFTSRWRRVKDSLGLQAKFHRQGYPTTRDNFVCLVTASIANTMETPKKLSRVGELSLAER